MDNGSDAVNDFDNEYSSLRLAQLHEQMIADLSPENFNDILANLERQFEEDESRIATKASSVEQLVIRLLIDEFNELQQSDQLGIIDSVGDLNLREQLLANSAESLDAAQHAAYAAYLQSQEQGIVHDEAGNLLA